MVPLSVPLYPLRFREILRNYPFGDRWIAREFGKSGLPDNHRISETWEVCDRPNGESSVVINGAFAGSTLHELISRFGADLLGRDVVKRCGTRFPLLVKLLDCTHALGEQVHHTDELARARGLQDPGKTEAWYMLRTRPGATLRCGPVAGLTREAARQHLLADDIRTCMKEYRAEPGMAFLLYAGTMHYSDGGLLFYEIMQNSDVYVGLRLPHGDLPQEQRGRAAEEILEAMHIEDGFSCQAVPVKLSEGRNVRTIVLACTHFALERWDLLEPKILEPGGQRFCVLTAIEGAIEVSGAGVSEVLQAGTSCLVPACLHRVTLAPQTAASVLCAYVPDLTEDIVLPLGRNGFTAPEIMGLGGHTVLNSLRPAI